MFYFIHFTDG
jgi:dolichyl-phosphate mannosyltransferase polypeptide 2 regulatory subunit